MIPSPITWLTVPSYRWTASIIRSRTGSRSLRASSGSRSTSSSIEPFRSAKSTVTCLRSPSRAALDVRICSARCFGVYDAGDVAAAAVALPAIGAPHSWQNLLAGGFGAWQAEQETSRRAPHSPQNFTVAGLSWSHRGHFTPEFSRPSRERRSERWAESSGQHLAGQERPADGRGAAHELRGGVGCSRPCRATAAEADVRAEPPAAIPCDVRPRSAMTRAREAEALRRAVALHRAGRLDEAEPLYRAILDRHPADADALHFLGLLRHQRGDAAAAIELIERAIQQAPQYADAHNNLGNLLKIAGRFEDAERAYRRAIALRPDDVSAHSNLGAALKAQGRLDAAEGALRRALALDDRHVPALTNMGHLLTRLGRTREALGHYLAAVAFDPDNPDSLQVLGSAYQAVGDIGKAREVYRGWLSREPDHPVARHLFAACAGEGAPERATDAFVRTTFDRLADRFDEHLADLE